MRKLRTVVALNNHWARTSHFAEQSRGDGGMGEALEEAHLSRGTSVHNEAVASFSPETVCSNSVFIQNSVNQQCCAHFP